MRTCDIQRLFIHLSVSRSTQRKIQRKLDLAQFIRGDKSLLVIRIIIWIKDGIEEFFITARQDVA